jgi:hypothetical protein
VNTGAGHYAAAHGGRPVDYAGQIEIEEGVLQWWSNASGHYVPSEEDAFERMKELSMDYFKSYKEKNVRVMAH